MTIDYQNAGAGSPEPVAPPPRVHFTGTIDPGTSALLGLATAPHWVMLTTHDASRWTFFTADIDFGEMLDVALAARDEYLDISTDALPWVRKGWPIEVLEALGVAVVE